MNNNDNRRSDILKKALLTKEDWQTFIKSDYAISEISETFSEILCRYIKEHKIKYGIKQADISVATGIDSPLITRYKYGRQKPTLYAVVLLSLAMKLSPEKSKHLLTAAGYALNNSTEHRIYKLFLQGCAFNQIYSIENCNELLLCNGFVKLST